MAILAEADSAAPCVVELAIGAAVPPVGSNASDSAIIRAIIARTRRITVSVLLPSILDVGLKPSSSHGRITYLYANQEFCI
jgi:hypothetical protein